MVGLDRGSRAYLDRLVALAKLEKDFRTERMVRKLDPENLGSLVQVVYQFEATTQRAPDTRDAARRLFEEQLNEEFPSHANEDDEEPPQAAPAAAPAPRRRR